MLLDDKAPGLTCTERLSCGAIVSFWSKQCYSPNFSSLLENLSNSPTIWKLNQRILNAERIASKMLV